MLVEPGLEGLGGFEGNDLQVVSHLSSQPRARPIRYAGGNPVVGWFFDGRGSGGRGAEIRHQAEWWGHKVDVDFHFLQVETVIEALKDAGFAMEARLERANYPQEAETCRGYVVARRAP